MRCVILCAGEFGEIDFNFCQTDFIIAADGGMDYAQKTGVTPDLIMGDFDSAEMPIPACIAIERFNPEKDDSDSILCVREGLKRGYNDFVLLYSLGNRLDHTIANLQTLSFIAEQGATGLLVGVFDTAFLIKRSKIIQKKDGYSVSIFAWGKDAKGVSLTGMKYPLKDFTISTSYPIGLSNVITENEAHIEISDGELLIVQSKISKN